MITEVMCPGSLDFSSQRRAVLMRDVKQMSFAAIAEQLHNVSGGRPTARTVANTYHAFSEKRGRRAYKYKNCGRKAWKLTKENAAFLVRRLLEIRAKSVRTAATLQRCLARERGVQAHVTTIQKVLRSKGYKWLPRNQKRKYDAKDKARRLAFAATVAGMTPAQANAKLSMSLDGVILTMPPRDSAERENYCKGASAKMWRKPSEANLPALAGANPMSKQVPLDRAIPMWGGVSPSGFSIVVFHSAKKLRTDEWATAVGSGKLRSALLSVNPGRRRGPWTVLCDGEGFLRARAAKELYVQQKITMWQIPHGRQT